MSAAADATETYLPEDQKPVGDLFDASGNPLYQQQYNLPGRPLWKSSGGTEYSMEAQSDGTIAIHAVQDVYHILELNKAMFNENNGYNWDKSMKRCASIPHEIRHKVLVETGGQVDLWRPETDEKYYKRFMNDIDNRAFRTAGGRL